MTFGTSSSQQSSICQSVESQRITRDALHVKTLTLDVVGAVFTWQATRGTRNLTVEYTDDVHVTLTETSARELVLTARDGSANKSPSLESRSWIVLGLSSFLSVLIMRNRWTVFALAMFLLSCSMADDPSCRMNGAIHVLVPSEYLIQFCESGQCWPVLCPLSFTSKFSNLPSNNELLFEDRFCTIKKPEGWEEWLATYFTTGVRHDYYGDLDNDGLVNILEFYGSAAFDGAFVDPNGKVFRQQTNATGTNPNDPDSDGDLLQDGFETFFNMDPNSPDAVDDDYDSDLLSNLDEQIYGLDPLNPDNDGDGVLDGEEIQNGGDPINAADEGRPIPGEQTANILLTIGDPSGSHSERYILHVGGFSHQSPDYGEVGSNSFTLSPGRYTISIEHAGTNLEDGPDHDYLAQVEKQSGNAVIMLDDPSGLLGNHNNRNPAGLTATLLVDADCPIDDNTPSCACARLESCEPCLFNDECTWSVTKQTCREDIPENGELRPDSCDQCEEWKNQELQEIQQTNWLNDLNDQIPCPCNVDLTPEGVIPTDQNATKWNPDSSCTVQASIGCGLFHPGSHGCQRSVATTEYGARQQCCYDGDGKLLEPSHEGAGTPDKSADFFEHILEDVVPYGICCMGSVPEGQCDMYREVRGGDNSHCPAQNNLKHNIT